MDAIQRLHVGETSPVIQTKLGFHIIQLTDAKEARQMSFDEGPREIAAQLENARRQAAVQRMIVDLSAEADSCVNFAAKRTSGLHGAAFPFSLDSRPTGFLPARRTHMSSRTKKNVGVIGLGIIGSRVREVLRRKGFHVFVWNRTPRPVPNFVGAPAELAEMCDHIQIFVSDDDALLDVVRQLSPGLFPRHIVIAHPTVTPHSMIAAAEIVERRGARFLEAPFTGSKEAAENGELVYYVGGEEAAVREARPTLEASSKEIMVIGEVGQATVIKITTNMITAASVQAAAEALALDANRRVAAWRNSLQAMKGNASNSKTLDLKLPKMIDGKFDPHFSVKHMLKDMQIASRMGLSHHLELGVTSAARDRLLEQMQRGHGDEDYSAIARKYFPMLHPVDNPKPTWNFSSRGSHRWSRPGSNFRAITSRPTLSRRRIKRRNRSSMSILRKPPEPVAASVETPKPETAPAAATEPVTDRQENVVEEEPEQRRRFFDRLLRRESNS